MSPLAKLTLSFETASLVGMIWSVAIVSGDVIFPTLLCLTERKTGIMRTETIVLLVNYFLLEEMNITNYIHTHTKHKKKKTLKSSNKTNFSCDEMNVKFIQFLKCVSLLHSIQFLV